jgi:hypothetical protein
MMALSEKQLYKKFCKVIEIPSLAKMDVEIIKDIQFYSRFLAIYISKMKKDWVRRDGNLNGQGRRNENISYEFKLNQECSNQVEEINNYVLEHPECDYRINDGSCLSSKAVFKNEVRGKKRKKKKKRFRKLWGNCPVLRDFKGRLSINQEMVLDRRKKRYQEEHLTYHEHFYQQEKKLFQ